MWPVLHESINRSTNATKNRFVWQLNSIFHWCLLAFVFLINSTEHQFYSIKCDPNHTSFAYRTVHSTCYFDYFYVLHPLPYTKRNIFANKPARSTNRYDSVRDGQHLAELPNESRNMKKPQQ